MSRQNNKTLQKHIAWLKVTGKMSTWLEKRLEWDESTRNELLNSLFLKHYEWHGEEGWVEVPF